MLLCCVVGCAEYCCVVVVVLICVGVCLWCVRVAVVFVLHIFWGVVFCVREYKCADVVLTWPE